MQKIIGLISGKTCVQRYYMASGNQYVDLCRYYCKKYGSLINLIKTGCLVQNLALSLL